MSEQRLTVTDDRTGKSVQAADREWDGARDGFAPDQNGRRRLRADDL